MKSEPWHVTRIRTLTEVRSAACHLARRGVRGVRGDVLPDNMSSRAVDYINHQPLRFRRMVGKARRIIHQHGECSGSAKLWLVVR